MPAPTLPSTLTAAYWSKQVGSLEKPTRMAGLLGDLKSRLDKLPSDLLELAGLADGAAAAKREQALKGDYDKAARLVAEQCKAIAGLAGELAARFKKDAGSAKQAAPAAAAVAKEASSFGSAVQDAGTKAVSDLKALAARLEAVTRKAQADQAKADKKAADEDGDDDAADQKDEQTFRKSIKDRMKSALNAVKREGAAPAKFRARVLGKNWGVFVGKSDGGPQDKIAWRLMGNTAGAKPFKGSMFWDPETMTFVFESATAPSGAAAAHALAKSLKDIIGYRPKVRVQKPGERGEDSEAGETDPDELDKPAKAKESKKAGDQAPAKAFAARLEALMPRIQAAVKKAGAEGKKLLSATEDAGKLAKGNRIALADKMLDSVESMLEKVDKARKDGPVSADIAKLALDWGKVRSAAVSGIDKLAAKIESDYANERDQAAQARKAADRLRGAARQLKPELDTLLKALALNKIDANRERIAKGVRSSVKAMRDLLQGDPLLKEVDGNELLPSMNVIKPMLDALSRAEAALR